jgi:hypothetical protein
MHNKARARMKAGLEELSRAKKGFDALERVKESAESAVQNAEAELVSFNDLDGQITKFRVAASKKGLNPKNLSDELKVRVSAQRDAIEEVDQAKKTLEAIEEEHASAKFNLRELENGRIKLVLEVFQEVAAGLLAELNSVNAKRQELMHQISGLAEVSVSLDGRRQFIGHTPYGSGLISLEGGPSISDWPGGISAMQANAKRWEERISALMENPDADITVPKPVKPADLILGPMPPGGLVFMRTFTLRPEA